MLLPAIISLAVLCTKSTRTAGQSTYGSNGKTTTVRREQNLDHLDSDTLAYFLDEYPGYDVAIMFYATWDSNSHTLAPYWAQIASLVDAGNTESRLLMGLFDCELNNAHEQLCNALNIKLLPTILFIGSGPFYDTDPITSLIFGKSRSAGLMGDAPVPNTVKFQGNWQYYDSVLDWIRAMRALSKWHTRKTKSFGKSPKKPLPVGIPGARKTGVGPGDTQSSADLAQIQFLERQIKKMENDTSAMEDVAVRYSTMMDTLMFGNINVNDMFTFVDERQAWKPKKPLNSLDEVFRYCLMELSLDYCLRVQSHATNKRLDEEILSWLEDPDNIAQATSQHEPYCGILESCIYNHMEDEDCRPKVCPFLNEAACRYVTSCRDAGIVADYANALGLSLDEPIVEEVDSEPPKKKWGF